MLCGSVYACVLTRPRTPELFGVQHLLIRRTWVHATEWHADPAVADGPEDVPESAEDSENGSEVRIQRPRC